MAEPFLTTYLPIVISIIAAGFSIWTFWRKQKSEELRIALDIHSKLEQTVKEAYQVTNNVQKKAKTLEFLNIWEFFAFLVESKEIKNENIKDFFKPRFVDEVKEAFRVYPDIEKDDKAFKKVKALLKEYEKDVKTNDNSKTSTA